MDYEIMVTNVNELSNSALKEQTTLILNAQNSLKRNQWDIVNAFGKILVEKLWEDDFDSQNKFGEFLGVSSGTMAQYRNAYRFVQLTNGECEKISVANAYELSKFIKDVETVEGTKANCDEYLEFEAWCAEKGYNILTASQKKLREYIKEFNSRNEAKEVADSETADSETADSKTADSETADSKTADSKIEEELTIDALEEAKKFVDMLDKDQLKELIAYAKKLNK